MLQINLFLKSQGSGGGDAGEHMSVEEVAMGFIRVANESMCRPIRALTQVNTIKLNFTFEKQFQFEFFLSVRQALHVRPNLLKQHGTCLFYYYRLKGMTQRGTHWHVLVVQVHSTLVPWRAHSA